MQRSRSVLFTLLILVVSSSVCTSLPSLADPSDPADRDPGRGLTSSRSEMADAGESLAINALEAPTAPLSGAERDMVAWAYDRFSLVGIDLPDLAVSFHEDTAPCNGHEGLYHIYGDRPQVRVCIPDRGTFAFTLYRQRGAERFAETIVWGLYDQLRRPTLIDVSCQDLHAGFHAITGFAAPGPLQQNCGLPGSSDAACQVATVQGRCNSPDLAIVAS